MKIEATQCVRLRNVSSAARRCGCSHSHLSRVLKGERKAGRELPRKLERMGVRPVAREEGGAA